MFLGTKKVIIELKRNYYNFFSQLKSASKEHTEIVFLNMPVQVARVQIKILLFQKKTN